MADADGPAHWIAPTKGALTLPVDEILTGRGFVTGKSGSGKSNTASVVIEELLDNGYDLLIVDPEGEYHGLKERYEVVHAGAEPDYCDMAVGPDDAARIAELVLQDDTPVVLDVSDFIDGELAEAVIHGVVEQLFIQERDAEKPVLLVIEEMQEYLPQRGGSGDLAKLLTQVAKRGRKRGLGMLGLSQRPAAVDKDFITQCDWFVWHRLTWQNDLDVVRRILGSDIADQVEELETGEAFLMTDWDESVERVQFRRKRTRDAGATPGLDSYRSEAESDRTAPPDGWDNADSGGTIEMPAETDSVDAGEADTVSPMAAVEEATEPVAPDESADEAAPPQVAKLRAENRRLEEKIEMLRRRLDEQQGDAPSEEPIDVADTAESAAAASPSRPTPPQRPKDRSGAAGTVVEFSMMLLYALSVVLYRIRLIIYGLRTGRRNA